MSPRDNSETRQKKFTDTALNRQMSDMAIKMSQKRQRGPPMFDTQRMSKLTDTNNLKREIIRDLSQHKIKCKDMINRKNIASSQAIHKDDQAYSYACKG